MNPATRAARAGIDCDPHHGAVVPPLHLSSTFSFAGFDDKRRYDYTRSGNPSRDLLGEALADLEGGSCATVVASGMAAINLVCNLLRPEDLLVVPHDCYGGSHRLFTHLAARGAFQLEMIDQNDEREIQRVLARGPRLVWIETPSNPLMRLVDVRSLANRAKAVGALTVVDNTFLSPAGQSPIALGADIVVHSTTKYINGHSDVVGGAVIAADPTVGDELAWWANCLGLTGAPFDAWLTMRGLRTLRARLRSHVENAQEIAEFLAASSDTGAVHYPGLATHPQHALATSQHQLHGGMLSFELGESIDLPRFLDALSHFSLAESLGGVESLIAHPATMTHAAMDEAARRTAGISDRLLRLSVGIEHPDDLLADLKGAFAVATRSTEAAA